MPEKKDTTEETNPKLPAVEPAQDETATPPAVQPTSPAQDETATETPETPPPPVVSSEQPVEPSPEQSSPHQEQIAVFANTLQSAVDHADEQAQVSSEYQDRWAWWRNKLGEFLHEVRQHGQS